MLEKKWTSLGLHVVPLGKALSREKFLLYEEVERWPATPKRARYSALIVSRDNKHNNNDIFMCHHNTCVDASALARLSIASKPK